MSEYRPLQEGHREIFEAYRAYAFHPEDGPREADPDDREAGADLGDRRGLYPDDPGGADPLCVCRHHRFDARVRGDSHPAPGLASVATPPEHRRNGYVGELLEGALAEYRDRGERFSILWPFRYRFYRQFGWETCAERVRVECPPEALAFAADARETAGSFVRATAAEYERLEPVYEASLGSYGLALERRPEWWRERVFASWDADLYAYAWEREGEPRGYLIYEISSGADGRTMTVRELAAADHEAFLALLAFCHAHDSQVSTVRLVTPPDAPLLDLAPDPEELECTLKTGPMVRVVDVADVLASLSYPAVDAAVTLEVSDSLADWNDGTFALAVENGTGTCDPTTAPPDVGLDVAALTQLVVGYRSATDLVDTGRLEVESSEALETLEALFPREPTYLADRF